MLENSFSQVFGALDGLGALGLSCLGSFVDALKAWSSATPRWELPGGPWLSVGARRLLAERLKDGCLGWSSRCDICAWVSAPQPASRGAAGVSTTFLALFFARGFLVKETSLPSAVENATFCSGSAASGSAAGSAAGGSVGDSSGSSAAEGWSAIFLGGEH